MTAAPCLSRLAAISSQSSAASRVLAEVMEMDMFCRGYTTRQLSDTPPLAFELGKSIAMVVLNFCPTATRKSEPIRLGRDRQFLLA